MLILTAGEGTITISQGALVSILIAVLGFIGVLVTLLHRDMTGKIAESKQSAEDGIRSIHSDLKPITITVALHDDKIKEIRKDHREMAEKMNEQDHRINTLEHKVDKLLP